MTEKQKENVVLAAVGVVVTALVAVIVWASTGPGQGWNIPAQTFSTSSTPAVKMGKSFDLTGVWESDNPDARFVATITKTSIDIDLQTSTGSLAYWSGSFTQPTMSVDKINSTPDPTKFTWSNAPTKEFVYLDGTLAFDYIAPGITSNVVLRRR